METTSKADLISIVGPTGSGKSNLALQIAGLKEVEIICADSRTIYKDMDIGTAKPTKIDQALVRHWGLDLRSPGERFSSKEFQSYAVDKIGDIKSRNKLPVLVGGTGLYIDSVLYNFKYPAGDTDSTTREWLNSVDIPELHQIIAKNQYPMPVNSFNRRHLIRTIERKGAEGSRERLRKNTLVIGLNLPPEILRARINSRIQRSFEEGVVKETEDLLATYGEDAVMKTAGIVYKNCIRLLSGEISEQTAMELTQISEWQYSRRQLTWFRKNQDIRWFEDDESAYLFLKETLNT